MLINSVKFVVDFYKKLSYNTISKPLVPMFFDNKKYAKFERCSFVGSLVYEIY